MNPPSLDFLTRRAEPPPVSLSPSSGTAAASASSPRRIPAWAVPTAIAAGFALLFFALFRDRLLPARTVETAPVLATAASATAPVDSVPAQASNPAVPPSGGAMIFQASGWIEPDPLPVKAAALTDGVVSAVHVLEGQDVEKGQLLAELVNDDARLALEAAKQRHRMLVSAREAHLAATAAAGKKRDAARAESAAAKTLGAEAEDQAGRFERLPKDAVSRSEVTVARLRLERERSLVLASQAKAAELEAEAERMELETRTKEDEIALGAVAVEQAELNLARTRVTAPITGRVLRLMAAPGEKKMLAMDHPDSSTICILYDPAKLQVRVDVPLADAAKMQPGQRVKIHCGLLPDKVFAGEVTRITGEADVQRNTLQAKVRIDDPAGELRPEMLCRVEFLEMVRHPGQGYDVSAGSAGGNGGALALWVHAKAVRDGAAWVFDPESKRVSRRTIQAGAEERDGYLKVISGLRPGEITVLSPEGLREGQRVRSTTLSE